MLLEEDALPASMELSPCRYCDSPEFEVRDDRTIDFWGVYCLDCRSFLGEVETLEALVWASRLQGYQRGWVYKQYLNFYPRPNLVELQEVEYILGYQLGWAEHEYERLYGEAVERSDPQVKPELRLSESSQIYRTDLAES
jgi:hypothetical protein